MENATCIYCKQGKPVELFNREHVIPQAFGTFENNLTLINCVCKECNSFFSRELELIGGRDSFEGLMRIKLGVKGFEKHKSERTIIQFPLEGNFKGALMEFTGYEEETDVWAVELIPQVAFKKTISNEKVFYPADKIPTKAQLIKYGLDIDKLWIYGPNEESRKIVVDKLKKLGINFVPQKQEFLSEVDNTLALGKQPIKSFIDNLNFRLFAKIAFNYLTYILNRDYQKSIIFREEFDLFREYVRYGKDISNEKIWMDKNPLLFYDTPTYVQTEGHIIVVKRTGNQILGKFRPFNWITYNFVLCSDLKGLYWPLHSAHHFDIESKECSEIKIISRKFLP